MIDATCEEPDDNLCFPLHSENKFKPKRSFQTYEMQRNKAEVQCENEVIRPNQLKVLEV